MEPRAPHSWPCAPTTKIVYFSSQRQSEDVKIPQAKLLFLFFFPTFPLSPADSGSLVSSPH